MSADVARLDSRSPDFEARLADMLAAEAPWDDEVERVVRAILKRVRLEGDSALMALTERLDRRSVATVEDLEIGPERLRAAYAGIGRQERDALEFAAGRIRDFHQHQRQESWSYEDQEGTRLGQQVTPIDKVGVYVPGGKAAYPSSVLMNVIPARIAGVGEVIMTVPTPDGVVNELVLAAAQIAGVDRVFSVGGAQAVGALAFGTDSVPKVDKIVGPGNAYVAVAKRLVFGVVGIDMIAGPSEILILCDASVRPDWVAMDLFSQAEHDEQARAVLLCPNAKYLDRVAIEISRLLPGMEREPVIRASLSACGALIKVKSIDEGVDLVNRIAPEHLELAMSDPEVVLPNIRHAGAVFVGRYTSEVLGDYCAGPNHVLPTSRTARFSSPLGVYDFQKRTSVIACTPRSAMTLGRTASVLARGEGLTAHARAAELRVEDYAGEASER